MNGIATVLPSLPREGFTRINTAMALCGMSRTTIWRRMAEGKFPASMRISPKVSVIRNAELLDWLADPINWRPANAKGSSDHQNAAA